MVRQHRARSGEKEKYINQKPEKFGMAKYVMKWYEATCHVSYDNGNGYSNKGSERKKIQVKADNYDVAEERVQDRIAAIRSQSLVKNVSLERIVQIRK